MPYYTKFPVVILFILISVSLSLEGEGTRWAIVIGISNYPEDTRKDFPYLPCAEDDASLLANILISSSCNFPSSQVLLLTNKNATRKAIETGLREFLKQSKPEDLVLISFFGHGVSEYNKIFWLPYDVDTKAINSTALPLSLVFDILGALVPARHIVIWSDHNRSPGSIGMQNDTLTIPGKKLSVLFSSRPQELAGDFEGEGIFFRFLRQALKIEAYLGRSPDANDDGAVTVRELSEFVSWAVPLSGMRHHPVFCGNCPYVLSIDKNPLPSIKVVIPEPPYVFPQENDLKTAGWVRSFKKIERVTIDEKEAEMGILPHFQARNFGLLNYDSNYYWFSTVIPISSLPTDTPYIKIVATDVEGCEGTYTLKLWKKRKGWFGETMPAGLICSSKRGEYIWTKDLSVMVYVQPGQSVMGLSGEEEQIIMEEIEDYENYLKEYLILLNETKNLKELLIERISEIRHVISQIGKRVLSLGRKVDSFTKVQDLIGSKGEDIKPKEEPQAIHNMQQELKEGKKIDISEEHFHYSWVGLGSTKEQIQEVKEIQEYLNELRQLKGKLQNLWKRHNVVTEGFYIDKYELSNKAYCKFCQETGHPYPSPPWWDISYFESRVDRPVVNVSWYDAQAYCTWAKKRLPTEIEWEKASRGSEGLSYPWGNRPPDPQRANAELPGSFEYMEALKSLPDLPKVVSSFPLGISPWGCHHMAGNVWEWCQDSFVKVYGSGLPQNDTMCCRGGAFSSPPFMLLSAYRFRLSPYCVRSDMGFRCVIDGK